MTGPSVHVAALIDLDAPTWHDLARLRVDVFVVEQQCAYAELDGRDAEPTARHLWTADERGPSAYLRLLTEPDGTRRIGRVCTAGRARGRGLSAALVRRALDVCGDGTTVVLDAQSHLRAWYERLGFAVDGAEFVEDGIPHVPMRGRGTAGSAEHEGPRS
ncbi:GNAT family N-acetyltransferase [Nocardioidaceae bacterium]|nr:GNAT family N-acetyltransferase [Nocardioidaceae bacterium]